MEIYILSEKKLKVIILKKLNDMQITETPLKKTMKTMHEENKFSKEIEIIKRTKQKSWS